MSLTDTANQDALLARSLDRYFYQKWHRQRFREIWEVTLLNFRTIEAQIWVKRLRLKSKYKGRV